MMVKTQTAQAINTWQVSAKSLTRLAQTAVQQAENSGFGKLPSKKTAQSLTQKPLLVCWPSCPI